MQVYEKSLNELYAEFSTDPKRGLSENSVKLNAQKYGVNKITRKKQKSLFKRVIEALIEPMMLILC
ncbi:MAG: hypothetical protein J6U25_03735, partial [Clostridia bacterium]|nr:hypothetical protein [Clostridia bacterium]